MYLPLVTGTLAATDTATSVPAGEVWMIYSITLNQPAASAANTVSLAIGGLRSAEGYAVAVAPDTRRAHSRIRDT